jgi:hypothetical protein
VRPLMSMCFLGYSAIVILTLSACTPHRTETAGTNQPPILNPSAPTDAESWVPQIISGSYKYHVSDSSIVSINNDTTNRVVPIETTMHYSLTVDPMGDSFSILGTVDSSTVNSQLGTKPQIRDSTKIDEFRGVLTKQGQLQLGSQEQSISCSSSSASLSSRIYEFVIPYPKQQLRIGDKWSDTVSSTNCHGRTPLTQQIIREFQVKQFTMWHEHSAVQVQRQTSIVFAGASSEPNTHLQANGSGSGSAILFVDQKAAVLLESNSQTKSTLTIVTSRGSFPFTQLTSTHITIQ